MPTVFVIGSGLIGGSLLTALKKEYPDFEYKVLVRSESDSEGLKAAGFIPVQGTLQDLDKIAELSAGAEVVVNAADADDVELANTILRGLKARHDAGKGTGTFIGTSGAMLFQDRVTDGKYDPNAKIWTDSEEDVKSYTTSMWHGQVDVPVLQAGEEGYVYTYIINPGNVYGPSTGPLKKPSVFAKYFLNSYIHYKNVFYVGEGSNILQAVHIGDLIDLYLRVFKLAIAGPPTTSSYERYYIATTSSPTWKEFTSVAAKELHKYGLVDSPEPKRIDIKEAGQLGSIIAGNLNVRAERAFTLGWAPKEKSYLEGIPEEIEAYYRSLEQK